MRIFILTLGTRGDLELFLTLGRELHGRGHHVILGTSGFYAAKVRAAGIEGVRIGNGTADELLAVLRSLSSVHDKTQRIGLYYKRWLRPQTAIAMHQITSFGAGADYFISNLKMMLRRDGQVMPGAAVTYDPPGALEDLAQYGTQQHHGRILDLVAMNKRLVDPQNLWGDGFHFTGFWQEERKSSWQPCADLAAFLDKGPPPVVVTMGSMVMFDTGKLVRNLTAALRLAGQRGIIVAGWSEIAQANKGNEVIHHVGEVPYDWLFPRACCVVHHGGCGTIAAVLRAGIPSIVLPQIISQEYFGKTLVQANLATGVFDVHSLQPADLASAINQAVTGEQTRASARAWQNVVSEERGVKMAADLIGAHWAEVNCAEVN